MENKDTTSTLYTKDIFIFIQYQCFYINLDSDSLNLCKFTKAAGIIVKYKKKYSQESY